VLAVRQLPQQARFGQRKAAVQQAFVQHADAARVEAVEVAQRVDARGGGRVGGGSHRGRSLARMIDKSK